MHNCPLGRLTPELIYMHTIINRKIQRICLITITLAYLGLAITYNVVNPLWESPDETGHFAYSVHLVKQWSLPVLEAGHLGESHQPPLYYALASIFLLPVDLDNPIGRPQYNPQFVHVGQGGNQPNASVHTSEERTFPYQGWSLGLHLVRLCSSLMGVGTIILTFLTLVQVSSEKSVIPLLASAFVAFNPQFLFISASANNDNLLILACTGLIFTAVRVLLTVDQIELSYKTSLGLGVWALVIVLTKFLGAAVVGISYLVIAIVLWRKYGFVNAVKQLGPGILLVLLGSSWWWLRNYRLYGDPLGYGAYQDVFAVNLRDEGMTWADWQQFAITQFRSYWGVFGWMNVHMPAWYYTSVLWGMALAGLGWLKMIFRRPAEINSPVVAFLASVLIAQQAQMMVIAGLADGTMWQGRYMFPVAGIIALGLAIGLLNISYKRVIAYVIVAVSVGLMFGVAVWVPGAVIKPVYAEPTHVDEVEIPNQIEVEFSDMFHLHGYALEQDALSVNVTLYWSALRQPDFDYSVFVHLIDEDGSMLGQDDQSPGSERNHPPTTWQTAEIVEDVHRLTLLTIPEGTYQLRVGVYNWATGERMLVSSSSEDALDIPIEPHQREIDLVIVLAGVVLIAIVSYVVLVKKRSTC